MRMYRYAIYLQAHRVGVLGVEPRPQSPEPCILPLYYTPMFYSYVTQYFALVISSLLISIFSLSA
jgi:hypothetical protein